VNKTHKTIFGTTEKSNFILNMGQRSVERLVTIGLCAAVLLPMLSGLIVAFLDARYFILAVGTYASGFCAVLFFLINALRGDVSLKKNVGFWLLIAFLVLAAAAYYAVFINPYVGLSRNGNSMGALTPLLGDFGRYEGLLTLICYGGIFLLALCAATKKTVMTVFFAIIFSGAVQAVLAVLQHLPIPGFPNAFKDLPTFAYDNVYLSFGAAESPIFYGTFVTLVFAVCSGVAVFIEGAFMTKRRRLIIAGIGMISFLTGLFTSSITPVIGCGAVLLILFILSIAKGGGEYFSRMWKILALCVCIFLIINATQGLWFRDKYIAGLDGAYRKFLIGPSNADTQSLYAYAWQAAVETIKVRPIFGVGPDGFANWQNYTPYTFDKAYNEYLHYAVTLGIPAAIVYIGLLGTAIASLIKSVKNTVHIKTAKNKADIEYPFAAVILAAVGGYAVQAFFSASTVTVSPIFWLLLGLSFSKQNTEARIQNTD
jgi:putative inorganic carbon (HCO3(-)) transporter